MKPSEYLSAVLKNQQLSKDNKEYKALTSSASEIENKLKTAFKGAKMNIDYGGSRAKGTLILEDYDLDLIAYFEAEDTTAGETLEDIYNSVKKTLEDDFIIQEKRSSLRLKGKKDNERNVDFHIDVVPGRYTDGINGDVFLYQLEGEKKRLKTNLRKHINHIKGSGLADIISLAKLWRTRKGICIKTFVLELLVIKALEGSDKGLGIDKKLMLFWETLRDENGNISIEDPANPEGNDLSIIWDKAAQANLARLAEATLNTIENSGWEDVFGSTEMVGDEEKLSSIQVATSSRTDRAQPWSC